MEGVVMKNGDETPITSSSSSVPITSIHHPFASIETA
jgi:hypothetical protein